MIYSSAKAELSVRATEGVNNDTADGFSEEKIIKIIDSLRNESYQPKPSRRTYRKKANGKMRPLGIPTFTDKLVQEVLRMILEPYMPTQRLHLKAVLQPKSVNCVVQPMRRAMKFTMFTKLKTSREKNYGNRL